MTSERALLADLGEDPPRPGHAFTVAMRGYDRSEVDAYFEAVDVELARLTQMVSALDERVRVQEEARREQAGPGGTPPHLPGTDDTTSPLGRPARPLVRPDARSATPPDAAADPADSGGFGQRVASLLALAAEESASLRAAAQQDAERIRAEAEASVDALTATLRAEAEQRISAARAEAERDRAEAQTLLTDALRHAESLVDEAQLQAAALRDESASRIREEEEAAQARLDALAREHRELLSRIAGMRDSLHRVTRSGSPVPRGAETP